MEVDITPLLRPHPPWLLWHVTARPDALADTLRESARTWRSLRGPAMRTKDEMLAEFQLALRLPDYFGSNWDALQECLGDLSWWQAPERILVIADAHEVLAGEPPSELATFLRILRSVASKWAQPELLPDGTQRKATPFHVVFQSEPSAFQEVNRRVAMVDAAGNFGLLAGG